MQHLLRDLDTTRTQQEEQSSSSSNEKNIKDLSIISNINRNRTDDEVDQNTNLILQVLLM